MTSKNTGVIYVVSQDPRFLIEALCSARTLRQQVPGLSVALMHDGTVNIDSHANGFDEVIEVPVSDFGKSGGAGNWGAGLLHKVRSLKHSPYDRTLYIDGDTRVLTPKILEIFDILENHEFAICECEPNTSRSQMCHGAPMFQCAVIGYRLTERVLRMLDAWEALVLGHLGVIRTGDTSGYEYVQELNDEMFNFMLENDQYALVQFFSPEKNAFDLNWFRLGVEWNYVYPDIPDGKEVIIHHAQKYKCYNPWL